MSMKLRYLAYINPFMVTQDILKKTMFFNLTAGNLAGPLLQLFIYLVEAVIILSIILIFHKIKIWFFFHGNSTKVKKQTTNKQKKFNNPYA